MKEFKLSSLIISLTLPFIAGGIGSFFTYKAIPTWYAGLNKPFFNPPNWVFGPVWTLLYIMMGFSLYQFWIWAKKDTVRKKGVKIYLTQLGLNTLWSIIFFGFQSPGFAFIIILILWFMIYLTIKHFNKASQISGWLLIPYLGWVSFAALLNLSIFLLN